MVGQSRFIPRSLVLGICLLTASAIWGQVTFVEEPAIRERREAILRTNRSPDHKIEVWRVQIAATTDRRSVEQARTAFRRNHPGLAIHSTYSDPYYKLQVGACFDKRNAQALLVQLKDDYPGAYLTRDKVPLSELTD